MTENLLTNPSGTSGCACGHHGGEPVLVAGDIPHALRHGAIFGAIGQLAPGASMILDAGHDPLPLLNQLREREGDAVSVEYLERETTWRLRFTRL
nr:DUF2249 domain-containing protein [Actinomycetales bacterium]